MKKLTMLVLFMGCWIAQSAHATIIASMPNQVGGRIDLYDIKTPAGIDGCKDSLIAKSWGNGGADIVGCWRTNDDLVVVKWENGQYRTYPMSNFTLKTAPAVNAKGTM